MKAGYFMSLEELARKSGRNMEALSVWLDLPARERPFFTGAKRGVDGAWMVPVLDAALFLTSKVEVSFSGKQAAALLGVSYPELTRRLVFTRAPKAGTEEIGAYFLGKRIRVPESEIVRVQTPAWRVQHER